MAGTGTAEGPAVRNTLVWRVGLLVLLLGCSGDAGSAVLTTRTTVQTPVASVSVSAPSSSLRANATMQLVATLRDAANNVLSGRTVTWSSSDATLATVSATGLVSGVLPGSVTITATSEGKSGSVALRVTAPVLPVRGGGLTGHFGAFAVDTGLELYGYGYSYYSAVYAVNPDVAANTQLGWGIWISPANFDYTGTICSNGRIFQSIEGGMGAWANEHFPSSGPRFHIVATGSCSTNAAGSPAFQANGEIMLPDKLGLAQLSNRLLMPPDHLLFVNTDQRTMFGYGWISLPLIPAYTSMLGQPTGDQNWTLFINTSTLKGPVAFLTNEFFSSTGATEPAAVGRGLDQKRSTASAIGLEICCTAMFEATVDGVKYRRVPQLSFAADANRRASELQDARLYSKAGVSDLVLAWLNGGAPVTQFNAAGIRVIEIRNPRNIMTMDGKTIGLDSTQFNVVAYQNEAGGYTFGLQWGGEMPIGVVPEYYKQVSGTWTAILPTDVPRQSWLSDQSFPRAVMKPFPPLDTGPSSPWTSAGWAAGPFSTTLSDGSIADYVWYKFVDQPAIKRLGLSDAVRQRLQTWVESLHAQGTNAFTVPAPSMGTLATIDPALIVMPPAGLMRGYVPIVIRQR